MIWASLFRLGLLALALAGSGIRAEASAVAGEYLTDVWNADDGMPDSSVTAITQTPDGYLWVGTYNGLARFDGIRFVTFDPDNTPALLHARVEKLYVDEQGTLWIATFDGSMTSMRRGKFTLEWDGSAGIEPDIRLVSSRSNYVTFSLPLGSLRRRPLASPPGTGWEELTPTSRTVRPLCAGDGSGLIWYRGSDRRLWRMAGDDFEPVPTSAGLTGSIVNGMLADLTGHLWVSTDKEIARWDGTRFQTMTPTNAAWPKDVTPIAVTADGRWWADAGGFVREAKDRSWLAGVASQKRIFPTDMSRAGALEDHQGGVWVYGYGQGLTHIAADGQQRDLSKQEGFPGDRITCFFEDREGNWWAGLDPGGLVRICARRFRTLETEGAVSTKAARSVCQETNGTIWIGTLGDGLARWQSGAFTYLPTPGGTGNGFAFSVCPDSRGRLWVSAGDQDLYVREGTEFKRVSPLIHGVKVIMADKSGGVWVGTKIGLYHGDGTSAESIRSYEGFGQHDVRALAEDGQGGVWAGTGEGTLFHVTSNTIAQFHPTDTKETQAIWTLLTDADGTVWAGTFRGGLMCFRDGKFTRFSSREGLPDNIICQILPDGAGNLWLGSHQGIFRVAKSALNDCARGRIKTLPCTVYGRSDGLPSVECSSGFQPAAWRAQDGRLWFTTVKGAVSVNPEEIRPNLLPPPVVMEEILVDGKRVEATTKSTENAIPAGVVYDRYQRTLEVPPGKHQFEFHYTGLNLASADRVLFRYRLEGADADWVDAGTRRSVQYDLLPPGTYRFQVIACNSDRVWNETGAALTLKVPFFYYETLWFRVLAWIVASGLTAGAVWYAVTRRLRVKMEGLSRQQAVERERARIAKDIHDDLGANLTLIAVLGGLAKQEKASERIEKMESTARQAVKSLDEIVWAVNPRNDTLAHLIDYTGQFAADYLRAAEIRCRLDVTEPVPPREVPSNVRHNVFLAVKEALQNIVKHAQATEVWLRVCATHDGLRIAVEDNGLGFAQAPNDALADGLRNMQQRMKEINGECRIQSRVGAGTEIVLYLPWGSA